MPVKSSKKKSSKKPSSEKTSAKKKVARKKTTSKKIKRDIARAVANIPDLVIRETSSTGVSANHISKTFTPQATEPARFEPPKNPLADIYRAPRHANLWLWTGVIIVTGVVLLMWSFNLKNFVYTTTQKNSASSDSDIFGTAKSDIQQILDGVLEDEAETDNQLDQIKTALTEEINKPSDGQQAKNAVAQSLANILVASASSTPTTSTPN